MLPKSIVALALFVLGSTETAFGRHQWLERDGRAVYLYPRRFGQEQPAVLAKLRDACPGDVCGTLAGQAVTPLLAAQPECSQQDLADAIIDASRQFDAATQANMIEIAKEYRQAEKNTPPDFTTNPPTLRNSVFCQKAPKNAELNGLVQAQDPANDPDIFFDPALKASVIRGTQANTEPFGGAAANPEPAENTDAAETSTEVAETGTSVAAEATAAVTDCPAVVTVTVTGAAAEPTGTDVPTVTVGGTEAAPAPTSTVDLGDADFGSCSVPQIEFGQGFDNRRETSFRPVDPNSFSQGSAQNINIITRAICDQLVNTCGANQAARDLCATAQAAAAAAEPEKTGIQADAFNQVFGITTQFAQVQPFDDQGRPVGEVPGGASTIAPSSSVAAEQPASTGSTDTGSTGTSGIGNFGRCSVPEIVFAQGLDGRRETAFEPADKASFNHGSAQNIDIITQFICDTLTNSCQADDTAKATCQTARAAASAATKGTGAQADAFNQVFGINTNFNDVPAVDNQGRVVAGTGNGAASSAPQQNNSSQNNNNQNNNQNNNNGGAAQAGNLQSFQGTLGGVVAPTVTALGDGRFQVEGNAAFNNLRNAVVRSCDVQNNQCANAANASGNSNGFNVGDCNAQQAQCINNAPSN